MRGGYASAAAVVEDACPSRILRKRRRRGRVANLVGDVGTSVTDIPVHLAHDTNVLVTVQERVLLVPVGSAHAVGGSSLRCGAVGLQARIGKHDNQSPCVLVGRSDWVVLLGNELGEGGGRKRLGSCHCGWPRLGAWFV